MKVAFRLKTALTGAPLWSINIFGIGRFLFREIQHLTCVTFKTTSLTVVEQILLRSQQQQQSRHTSSLVRMLHLHLGLLQLGHCKFDWKGLSCQACAIHPIHPVRLVLQLFCLHCSLVWYFIRKNSPILTRPHLGYGQYGLTHQTLSTSWHNGPNNARTPSCY